MNSSHQKHAVLLGAFLHDIGKALQRGDIDSSGAHQFVGADFLEQTILYDKLKDIFSPEDLFIILDSVKCHHNKHFARHKGLIEIITQADSLSAKERDADEENQYMSWTDRRKFQLRSVFQDVSLDSVPYNIDHKKIGFASLSLEKSTFFPKSTATNSDIEALISHSEVSFKKVFIEFVHNYPLKNFNSFFNALYLFVYHYFWCIPANTKEPNPTVSLFDHLKTTGAFASCLYDYHYERNEIDDVTQIKDRSIPKFRLLVADFSGIQKYIFSLQKETGSAKRLRSRSFFIEILLEEVKQMVLTAFNLTQINVFFQSGGKFYILLPNIVTVEQRIQDIQKQIDDISFEKFNAEISLNLSLSDAFSAQESENFHAILFQTSQKLFQSKHSPFRTSFIDKTMCIDSHFEGKGVCSFCEKFPITTQYDISGAIYEMCFWCSQDVQIGEKLKKQDAHYIHFYSEYKKGRFQLFKKYFSIDVDIQSDAESLIVYNPYQKNVFSTLSQKVFDVSFDLRCIANHVPENMDFQAIAKESTGKEMLGVLKGDVDNLGQIFSVGLYRDDTEKSLNSPSRQATLSRTIDLFFSGYFNEYVKEHHPYCYITYAGGDDFLVIGPWDDILKLAKNFQKEFTEFVQNPEITLSAGISFCKPKFPIARAIDQAEQALEQAKNTGKNRLCAFDCVLKWEDLESLWKEKDQLFQWGCGENPLVSIQFVRHLLDYGRMMKVYQDTKNAHYLRWQPMLAYQIARNYEGEVKKEVKAWAKAILENKSQNLSDGHQLSFISSFVLYLLRN